MSFHDLRMGSEARLWELIESRTRRGADVAAIDRLIWDLYGEEWAIVYTDLAGFSRRVARFGIIHFLQVIYEAKKLLFPIVSQCGGSLVKSDGDSVMLLFRTAGRAVEAAIEMQRACHSENARRVPEDQILFCVGVGFGKLLRIGESDVWGEEVNAASKLGEDIAQAHEILVTSGARQACGEMAGVSFEKIDIDVAGSNQNYRAIYAVTP